ncbi:MAG: hypothetical protein NVSMB24_28430 [Mucilaginibacter sp.]
MSGVNKVMLIGHIGKDPDLRYLDNGDAVANFPLVTTTFTSKKALNTEQPEWHNIVVWRGLAKAAHKLLKKGKLAYLEGKSKTRSFTDKNGNNNYITEIVVDYFALLGRENNFEDENNSPIRAMTG